MILSAGKSTLSICRFVHNIILTSLHMQNDSGYSSPLQRSGEACKEKVHFVVENPSTKGHDTVIAEKEDTLADVLIQNYRKINMKNTLTWAEIRDHDGLKCVNPYLLPCGFIKPGTEVKMEQLKKTIYDYEMKLADTKPYLKLQATMFFISITNRKRKRDITKVRRTDLLHCDMCVIASPSQTFKEALKIDRRFVNVDHFTLKRKQVEGGASVGMEQKPADFPKEVVVEVNYVNTLAPAATKGKSVMPKTTSDVDTAEESISNTPKKKQELNKLVNKLWEKKAVYVFSKDAGDLTSKEMRLEMKDCLKARAWCTLVGPQDRGGTKYERSLVKRAKNQFANHNVISRPVTFSKTISGLYDSVGFLKCGDITATCFLVTNDMIITNWHVVNDIIIARRSSTSYDHSEVYVHFDYEETRGPQASGYKLMPLSHESNIICERFDYAILALEDCVEEKLTLGESVRTTVPEQGKVCIVGHPSGQEKQDELCLILPLHDDRRSLELERRLAENEERYRNSPSASTFYMYRSNIRRLYGDNSTLTYDVGSMFEGSSGAPIFDMKANIVALHTLGFRLGDTSIVEVGVTFKAIINHLKESGHSDFVREYFPRCLEESEDEDMDLGEEMDTD